MLNFFLIKNNTLHNTNTNTNTNTNNNNHGSGSGLDGVHVGSVIIATAPTERLLGVVHKRASLLERLDAAGIPETLGQILLSIYIYIYM